MTPEAAGKDPQHRRIQSLVGELSTQSGTFRDPWAARGEGVGEAGCDLP